MALIETKYWMVRSDIARDNAQDAADMAANDCVAVQGWPDAQIIAYREGQDPPLTPSLEDGWVRSEFNQDELELPKTKTRRNFKLDSSANVGINFSALDEANAWIEVDQDIAFSLDTPAKAGDQYNLLITNASGSTHAVTFDPEFLVDHESQLADNDADIPDGFGVYLEFIGLPGNKLLLKTLIVRQI